MPASQLAVIAVSRINESPIFCLVFQQQDRGKIATISRFWIDVDPRPVSVCGFNRDEGCHASLLGCLDWRPAEVNHLLVMVALQGLNHAYG